jgi:hypothetical protein
MSQHKISPLLGQDGATAQILDFEAAKAARLARRMAASEIAAAQALTGARGGQGSLQDLLRALVAPYNSDPC